MLPSTVKKLSENIELHVIEIKEIDSNIEILLDNFLVSICEGSSNSQLVDVKKSLKDFLIKKTEDTRMGAIAELFIHLYLRINNYRQEFLFRNLEEGSIKKGFDGYFSKNSETYIVESKSGAISTKGIKHRSKLNEAYNDLNCYITGTSKKGSNNPWRNAYNHASHCDVGTEKSIRDQLKLLSDLYDKSKYKSINEFNIVPCSTIFLDDNWNKQLLEDILTENEFITKYNGKSVKAICITKKSIEMFNYYLSK